MVVTQAPIQFRTAPLKITWEKLPDNYKLEEEPVDNTGQPLIAGALRETLELIGFIKPEMLIASNLGLCATVDGQLVIKAPDWVYVSSVEPLAVAKARRSYTPNLEGEVPEIVMEFLSETEGGEYSVKRTYPPGKWFFYEQILKVKTYVIFEPEGGLLEVYRLQEERYQLEIPNEHGRHWIPEMRLFLGTWRGKKEEETTYWLRWWDEAGNLLPWAVEQIEIERQRAEREAQRAEREAQRAERLAEYLRSQGINPDELS
ncbi:hypothetical protein BCD67_18040 [Oscillatoriales cyanobacterium USR001]|nr:hypothetical protein BCD67_18040 [Oscillatoriales cyanobacterium USR001]